MTCKRSLYARTAALVLTVSGVLPSPGRAAEPLRPPCGDCVTLGMSAEGLAGVSGEVPTALVVPADDIPALEQGDWARVRTVVLSVTERTEGGEIDRIDLLLRRMLTEVRARQPAMQLGVLAPMPILDALLSRDLPAYIDFVAVEGPEAPPDSWRARHPGLHVWRVVTLHSFHTLLNETMRLAPGGRVLVWPAPVQMPEVIEDVRRLAAFFPDALAETSPAASCDPPDPCRLTSYLRADTRETIVRIERQAPGRAAIAIRGERAELAAISTAVGAAPGIADSVLPLTPAVADAGGTIRLYLPFTGVTSLLVRVAAAEAPVVEDVRVTGARELTADEIVARHQAQAARQKAIVRTLVTRAETTLTFEVSAFPAPVTIQASTVIFQGNGPVELL